MPIVEVDEEDFMRSQRLTQTVAAWMKNPKARRKLLEANKEFDPTAKIPELDQPPPQDAFDMRMSPLVEEIKALRTAREEEKAERDRERVLGQLKRDIELGFDKLRKTEGLLPNGEASVRKLMEEKGLIDPEIAWAYHQRLYPANSPVTPGSTGPYNLFEPAPDTAEDMKKLMDARGENNMVLDKMIRDTLQDFRR